MKTEFGIWKQIRNSAFLVPKTYDNLGEEINAINFSS